MQFTAVVSSFHSVERNNQKFVEYSIVCRGSNGSNDNTHTTQWTVRHRFNDFKALVKDLKKRFPQVPIPSLPETTLGRCFDTRYLESKRSKLSSFMRAVLSTPELANSQPVSQFLAPPLSTFNKPSAPLFPNAPAASNGLPVSPPHNPYLTPSAPPPADDDTPSAEFLESVILKLMKDNEYLKRRVAELEEEKEKSWGRLQKQME